MISRSRRRPRPTPATGRRTASVLCGPIARRQSPPRDRLLSRASGYPDQPASGQVRAGRNQFRCSPRKAQGAALAALAANGPTAGPCFKRPYLAAVKFLAESRRGRIVEGSCGFCIFKAAPDPVRTRPRRRGEHGKSAGNLFFRFIRLSGSGRGLPAGASRSLWIETGEATLSESRANPLPAVECRKTIVVSTSSMRGRGALPLINRIGTPRHDPE